MYVSPTHVEKEVETASRVSGVLGDRVKKRFVVGGVDLAAGLGPCSLSRGALNGREVVDALDLSPVPDAGSNASQVVGLGLDVGRRAKAKFMLHDQLAARRACW